MSDAAKIYYVAMIDAETGCLVSETRAKVIECEEYSDQITIASLVDYSNLQAIAQKCTEQAQMIESLKRTIAAQVVMGHNACASLACPHCGKGLNISLQLGANP